MDRITVASAVAESLFATETAVEDAFVQTQELMRRMIEARRAFHLSSTLGDQALVRVTAAVEALGKARRDIVRTHGELGRLGNHLGLGDLGFGPLVKPLEGRAERLVAD